MTAMMADRTGHSTQVLMIFEKVVMSVGLPENRFQPMIAPTMACEVETGRPDLVME